MFTSTLTSVPKFKNLNLDKLQKSVSVLYDVKGILPLDVIDGRL